MIKRIFHIIGALVLGTLLIGLFPSQTDAASENWWDINYLFRRQITVTTGENSPYNGYAGYTVEMIMDTVNPDIQDDGDDIRIVWWNGSDWQELDRHIIDPNTASTIIRFRLQADIAISSSDDNYYIYYGNASAGTGPINLDNVYLHYDDFSTDRSSGYYIGRLGVSGWHGSYDYSPPYDAINERISYDTGDNYAGEWVVADIDERDVYLEIQLQDSGRYPTNTTPGILTRIQWATPGSYINDFYSASFSQGNYNESGIGRNARNATRSAYDPTGTNYYANNTAYRFYFAVWGTNSTHFKADFMSDSGQLVWQPEASPYVNSTSAETSDLETSGQVGFLVSQQRGWIDEFMVRRYVEPEPIVVIGTKKPIPVVAVTTNEAINIEVNSARLNGNLDDLGTAASVDISFEWGEIPGGPYPNETIPQTMGSTGGFSFDLDSLTLNTTYYFRAKGVGDSISYGTENSFITLTPPTVTTNDATNIEVDSAQLRGNLDDLGTAVSVDVSFEWGEISGGPYPNETTPQTISDTGVFSFDIDNLSSNTTYYFRTKATGDNTVNGIEKSFTTLTPPTVTTSNANNLGDNSVRLNGILDDTGTAVLVNVSFEWGLNAGGPYTNETTLKVMSAADAFGIDLNNLIAETTYYFRAKAVGDSTVYGMEKSFTTPVPSTGSLPFVENDTEPIEYFLDIIAQGFQKQLPTDVNGRLLETADITLSNGILNVRIPEGIVISDQNNKRLKVLDIDLNENIPLTSKDVYLIGPVCTLLPEGTTFRPSIILSWEYNLENLPEGINEEDLILAYYDTNTGDWIRLNSIIDTGNHTISTEIEHPMTIATFYVKAPLAVLNVIDPTESPIGNITGLDEEVVIQDPITDPNELSTVTNPTALKNNNWQSIVVIVFGILALAGIVSYLIIIKKMKLNNRSKNSKGSG